MPRPTPVHDPQVLRAIAHPVRNRILAELDARGSLRAADLAKTLDVPANQASFHLRQLAKYGLIEEDTEAARDRRDRVWRLVHTGGMAVEMAEIEKLPGGKAASQVFRRTRRTWGHLVVDSVLSGKRTRGTYRGLTDSALLLSKDEAVAFTQEIDAVLQRWSERTRDGDEERITYLYYAAVLPYPAATEAPLVEPGGALAPSPLVEPGGALAPRPLVEPGGALAPSPLVEPGGALAPTASKPR